MTWLYLLLGLVTFALLFVLTWGITFDRNGRGS